MIIIINPLAYKVLRESKGHTEIPTINILVTILTYIFFNMYYTLI